MFRKIHSNRDPRDTLLSELKKEFAVYFNACGDFFRRIIGRNPRFTFGSMVFLMVSSLIISFAFFRHQEKAKSKVPAIKVSPVQDGFSQIIQAGERLKMTLRLKHLVDSLSSKKMLTAKDSLALDSALDHLQSIQKTIK